MSTKRGERKQQNLEHPGGGLAELAEGRRRSEIRESVETHSFDKHYTAKSLKTASNKSFNKSFNRCKGGAKGVLFNLMRGEAPAGKAVLSQATDVARSITRRGPRRVGPTRLEQRLRSVIEDARRAQRETGQISNLSSVVRAPAVCACSSAHRVLNAIEIPDGGGAGDGAAPWLSSPRPCRPHSEGNSPARTSELWGVVAAFPPAGAYLAAASAQVMHGGERLMNREA